MADYSELLKELLRQLETKNLRDSEIHKILQKVEKNIATHLDGQQYAIRLGQNTADVIITNLLDGLEIPDYYKLEDTIMPLLKNDHELVNNLAARIQQTLYEKANLGLNPIKPALEEERAEDLINAISDAKDIVKARKLVDSSLVDLVQHFDDKFIEDNASQEYKAGLKPKIRRMLAGGSCDWCRALAGTYDYPNIPKDVYRRHQNCRCVVTYDPGDGRRQDVHTKKWALKEEYEQAERGLKEIINKQTLEEKAQNIYSAFLRKGVRAEEIVDMVNNNHEGFRYISPEQMYHYLKASGYSVKPLNKGDFKKLSFEQGGGFRISFGGDGYFQYHPQYTRSNPHHESPYWRIGNGERGMNRYGMDGRPIS